MKLLMAIPISCDPNRSTSGREHRVRQWGRKAHRSEGGGGIDRGWVAAIVPVAGEIGTSMYSKLYHLDCHMNQLASSIMQTEEQDLGKIYSF
jgi:hypothetical protein